MQPANTAPTPGTAPTTRTRHARWAAWGATALLAVLTAWTLSADAPPAIPAINLSADPLYAAGSGDKPALALALSVEFPTVGAQYVDVPNTTQDRSYANTREYLGYYDAESCYTYVDMPTEVPVGNSAYADHKRFVRSGPATQRQCADAFSGNFLNWASSSAVDMLRLALSGGDRSIDTPSLTILQRAVLPSKADDPICMWNSTNFPAKQLKRDGGGSGRYWGAVPAVMARAAGRSDIWVANSLNRIYFGTTMTGSCTQTANYRLGGPTSRGPTAMLTGTGLPTDAASCASEDGTCFVSGLRELWYGSGTSWAVTPVNNDAVSCSNALFGDPAPTVAKACYTRPYSGTWTPAADALNSDGYFFARVQVCDAPGGTLQDVRDYPLCKRYPAGNFKPEGAIQRYSDQLRLAAFGYVMDQTASYNSGGRYGGVLRAPMKFVGARTYDINGQDNTPTGGNPKAEWNSQTGVFVANPDGDSSQSPAISGVINYLNRFGRTGPVPGRYKKYDPVGELYYETLRYLQGLQPSPDAIRDLTPAMYDGFPVYTTWTDPYGGGRSRDSDYSCTKSNIVVIGDINTHDGDRYPAANAGANIPDIRAWTQVVDAFEKNRQTSYLDGQGVARSTGNPNGANDAVPSTRQLLGAAYWARTHDIRGTGWTSNADLQRPGLRVKTFAFDVNEYADQNVDATRRSANQLFMAAKYGGFETDPSNPDRKPYNTWGNPFQREDGSNDNAVWQDTTRLGPNGTVGEASTYYLQSNARGVLSAFDAIFNRAATQARSIAGGALQSKELTQAGGLVYQGSFDTANWSGDLLAIATSVSAGGTVTTGSTPTWTAAARLQALPAPATSRNIVVGRAGATSVPAAVPFLWDRIDSTLQQALDRQEPGSTADGRGRDRLNFLRGDRSLEGSVFRRRGGLLGDIVNSGVAYSGTPTTALGEPGYRDFFTLYRNRRAAVFVGANDGMLHAFDAATGDELFGFIPSWLGRTLPVLTDPGYATKHRSYVDASPAVAEARTGTAGTAADWKTVLVSGTGGGGAGVFALDVSDPTAFDAGRVLWEFTRADDADLGQVVGKPRIVKLRTAPTGTSFRWFALVPGGVNNYLPDADGRFSATGEPALYLLALDKKPGEAWTRTGSQPNYYRISLPIDSATAATQPSGLLNFSATFGDAGELDTVFAGDLHGRLWKLVFKGLRSADWTLDKLSGFRRSAAAGGAPLPMFAARDAGGRAQPISMAPVVANAPVKGMRQVAFGTGKYLEFADKSSTAAQSFYALLDDGSGKIDDDTPNGAAIAGRGRLQAGTATASTLRVEVPAFLWGRPTSDTDLTRRAGWYFDFPRAGEREVSNARLLDNLLVFSSLLPAAAGGGGCKAGGDGFVYAVNIDTGNGTVMRSQVGMMGEPVIFELPELATVTVSDSTGGRVRTSRYGVMQQGSGGNDPQPLVVTADPLRTGRQSWRQIHNYQQLRLATP